MEKNKEMVVFFGGRYFSIMCFSSYDVTIFGLIQRVETGLEKKRHQKF